jgi:hypothetical protein
VQRYYFRLICKPVTPDRPFQLPLPWKNCHKNVVPSLEDEDQQLRQQKWREKRRKESDLEVQKNQIKKKEQAGFDRKTDFNLQILCSPTYHPELPVMRKHELYYAT